jgi:hypothetical protein
LQVNLGLLESARKGISYGRYYEGTFNIISDLIFDSEERYVLVEDRRVQESIDCIFQETEKLLGHGVEFRPPQVQLCAKELEYFMGGIPYRMGNIVYASSFYDRIISFGNSLLLVARGTLPRAYVDRSSIIEPEGSTGDFEFEII